MVLYIKYMLSNQCVANVTLELKKLNVLGAHVHLGKVELYSPISSNQFELLKTALLKYGLDLVDIKATKTIERIKALIKEFIQKTADSSKVNISYFLTKKIDSNYIYLSKLFKEVTGKTIEHYNIYYKVELVKEFLLYTDLTITEISYKLNYSSSAHLTAQFKKLTGVTPSFFRNLKKIKCNLLYNCLSKTASLLY